MFILLSFSLIIILITRLLIIIASIINKKTFIDREKNFPFECGFDPKSSARIPFSLHFFLIAIIFLIFDVEITLICPLVIIIKITNILNYILISFFLLIILLLGLYHEWNQEALDWEK